MSQPQALRQRNRRQVVQALLDHGSLTRPALADELGVSKVTAAAIVQELQTSGWLTLGAGTAGRTGRTAQTVHLASHLGAALAIDLQNDQITVHRQSVVSADHDLQLVMPGPVATADGALSALRQGLTPGQFGAVRVVVISVPAPVDHAGDIQPPNALNAFDERPLRRAVEEAGAALRFENDANLVALDYASRTPWLQNLATVIERPSGIGMGLILNGELYRGRTGRAGEFGQIPVASGRAVGRLETLPPSRRIQATARALATLVVGLDLEHLVVNFERGDLLVQALRQLLEATADGDTPPLDVSQEPAGTPLLGAAHLSLHLARQRLLTDAMTLGTLTHVA